MVREPQGCCCLELRDVTATCERPRERTRPQEILRLVLGAESAHSSANGLAGADSRAGSNHELGIRCSLIPPGRLPCKPTQSQTDSLHGYSACPPPPFPPGRLLSATRCHVTSPRAFLSHSDTNTDQQSTSTSTRRGGVWVLCRSHTRVCQQSMSRCWTRWGDLITSTTSSSSPSSQSSAPQSGTPSQSCGTARETRLRSVAAATANGLNAAAREKVSWQRGVHVDGKAGRAAQCWRPATLLFARAICLPPVLFAANRPQKTGRSASWPEGGRETHRLRTQVMHREPPYARETVFCRLEILAYWSGRSCGSCERNNRPWSVSARQSQTPAASPTDPRHALRLATLSAPTAASPHGPTLHFQCN